MGSPALDREAGPLPELPGERHGHRAELAGGLVLVFGGFGDAHSPDRGTRETWALDLSVASDERAWVRRADLNRGKAFHASVVVDGAAFAIGTNVERYDAAADRWEVVYDGGELPESHLAAAAIGRRVLVVGGYPADRRTCVLLDLETGELADVEPPPGFGPGHHFHFVAALAGRWHVIGGMVGGGLSERHWARAAGEGERWVERAALPEPSFAKFNAWTTIADELWIFGGRAAGEGAAYVGGGAWRYSAATDTWTSLEPLPEMRVMPAAVVVDGVVHSIAGVSNQVQPLPNAAYDPARRAWTPR